MALGTGYAQQHCNLARALEILGERWTLLVLRDCFYGVRRFTDLLAHLDISRAVLCDRLDSLVAAGLLERPSAEGRSGYVLTDAGLATWPSLYALSRWGARFAGEASGSTLTHADCATVLDERGECPACGTTPPPGDLVLVPGPDAGERTDPVSVALREPHRLLTPIPA